MSCPTCAAIAALLRGSGLVSPARAQSIGYSENFVTADKVARDGPGGPGRKVRAVRKASGFSKKLSRALKEANKKARKKNGSFKKGWDQRRVMSTAQRIARRL
jgi:hypothetical protein